MIVDDEAYLLPSPSKSYHYFDTSLIVKKFKKVTMVVLYSRDSQPGATCNPGGTYMHLPLGLLSN